MRVQKFPVSLISRALALVAAVGWDVSPYDEAFLGKALERRRAVTGLGTMEAYLDFLAGKPSEAEALVRSLSITCSEFFRNPLAFALLEQRILPGLFAAVERTGRREIRIWSAACAAGQEAFSVAMLLEELITARDRAVSFRLFATDRAAADLETARTGHFSGQDLQNVKLRYLKRFFVLDGEGYTLLPALRDRVDFSSYDLMDDRSNCPPASIYGDFDLVLCCNVLLYYRPPVQQSILGKVFHSLTPKGYLITDEAEREIVTRVGGFRAVVPGIALFQKSG